MTKLVGYDDIRAALIKEGLLPERMYLDISEEYILELLKTIYGLVQAAWEWYQKMRDLHLQLEYKKCTNDPCLFYKNNETGESIFNLYVNNLFAVGVESALENTITELEKEYMLVVNRDADEYLGCKIKKTSNGKTVISQPDILKRLKNVFF